MITGGHLIMFRRSRGRRPPTFLALVWVLMACAMLISFLEGSC